jgi:hypothetical protein
MKNVSKGKNYDLFLKEYKVAEIAKSVNIYIILFLTKSFENH